MTRIMTAAALTVVISVSAGAWGPDAQQSGSSQGSPPPQSGPRRPTPPPAPSDAAGALWNIDTSHTSAQFAVRHLLVSTVRGRLGPVVGWVKYDGTNVSSLAVHAVIDVTGINTGSASRDRDLRSDNFLLAEQFPDITFVSKRVENVTPAGFNLVGDLTIRGLTKEATLTVEGPSQPVQRNAQGPPVIGATATTTINRKEFGVKYNALIEAGGAVVSDEVRITIDIEARKR